MGLTRRAGRSPAGAFHGACGHARERGVTVRAIGGVVLGVGACALALWVLGAGGDGRAAPSGELSVAAAASLTDAAKDLARDFERSHGVRVRLDFGSSGMLRKKIEAGAAIDVFLSASAKDTDALERAGHLGQHKRRNLLGNSLVCVTAAGSGARLARPDGLLSDEVAWLAVADPAHAPAGQYARQALATLGLWERLSGKVVRCPDVRAALAHVAMGHADAAIVYRSDVGASAGVAVAFALPREAHEQIVYPAGVLANAPRPALGEAFLDLLASPRGAAVFARHGFVPLAKER